MWLFSEHTHLFDVNLKRIWKKERKEIHFYVQEKILIAQHLFVKNNVK